MTSERGSCVLAYGDVVAGGQAWGGAVTAEVSAADENAAFPEAITRGPAQRTHQPAAHRRTLVYGILGPHAVSVTYRAGGSQHKVPVVPGLGAFLIVLPDSGGGHKKAKVTARHPAPIPPAKGPGRSGRWSRSPTTITGAPAKTARTPKRGSRPGSSIRVVRRTRTRPTCG